MARLFHAGATRRMSRIFRRDGRAVIVALDHGSFMREPMDGLMRVADTVRQVVAGGADAVLAPAGTAAAAVDALADTGLILSVNAAHPAVEKQVDTAVALGADGVKCMLYPFADGAAPGLTGAVGLLAAHARQVGMPLMVEPIPGGWTAGPAASLSAATFGSMKSRSAWSRRCAPSCTEARP